MWLDPPWGGKDEWNKPDLRLKFYGEPRVYANDFIKTCFKECNIPMCILKCPSKTYLRDFLPNEYKITKLSIKHDHPKNIKLNLKNYELFQLVIISRVKKGVRKTRSRSRSRSNKLQFMNNNK